MYYKHYKKIKKLHHKRKFVKILIVKKWIDPTKKAMQKMSDRDLLNYIENMNFEWIDFCEKSGYGNKNMFIGMVFKLFPRYIKILKTTNRE